MKVDKQQVAAPRDSVQGDQDYDDVAKKKKPKKKALLLGKKRKYKKLKSIKKVANHDKQLRSSSINNR